MKASAVLAGFGITASLLMPQSEATSVDSGAQITARNILFVTFDALRKDHLSAYGYPRNTAPNIKALADRGLLVDGLRTDSPFTFPSHLTHLTGVRVTDHGSTYNGQGPSAYPTAGPLIRMRDAGWRNAAVVSSFVIGAEYGLQRYFRDFDDGGLTHTRADVYRNPTETTAAAIAMLRRLAADKEPFFLWVHYVAPHRPYESPARFMKQVGGVAAPQELVLLGSPMFSEWKVPSAIEVTILHDAYDARIAYGDWELGQLLGELDDQGLRSNTAIVFSADHGEELDEQNIYGDHQTILNGTMAIPLVIAGPGIKPGKVATLALTTEMAPTFLELVGLSPQRRGGLLNPVVDQTSQLVHVDAYAAMKILLVRECRAKLKEAADAAVRETFDECSVRLKQAEVPEVSLTVIERSPQATFELTRYFGHYEHHTVVGSARLFNLMTDPKERVNLLHERRDVAARLNQVALDHYPEMAVTSWTVQQQGNKAATLDAAEGLRVLRGAFAFPFPPR